MKKYLLTLALAAALAAAAQAAAQPQDQPGQQGQPAQDQKTIKDPAEYNAYVSAIREQNPQVKISALEGFLQQYPNSVVREDALESLMGAYQQTGNLQQTVATAQRLLQANSSNLSALAVLAFIHRQQAEAGQNPQQNAAQARQFAERGLQAVQSATIPEGISEADWQKRKEQLATIFHSTLGFAALQTKDYATARTHLREAVQADPNSLAEVYRLALAHLEGENKSPQLTSQGLWFIARAGALAPAQAKAQITDYGRKKYIAYHGSEEGWSELIQQASATPMPPDGFVIKEDTPADRAARMVKSGNVKEMSLAEWEFILANGDQALTDQVWKTIEGLGSVALVGNVVEASARKLSLAGTADAIEENRANVELTMRGPIPANVMPKTGQEQAIQGKPVSYTANPFMLVMEDGVLIAQPKAEATPRRRR